MMARIGAFYGGPGSTLTRKLLRQIGRTRGQFASLVAVVAIGIMVFVLMRTSYRELYDSLDRYYRQCSFGDLLVEVRRAPAPVVDVVRRVEGVSAAEGRLVFDARLEVPGSPAASSGKETSLTGRVVGVPDVHRVTVNDLYLLSGKRPIKGSAGVLVDPKFAAAHGLVPGDELILYAGGKAARVTVSGTATSPEFIYAIKDPSTLLPDPRAFGVLFMSQYDAASIYGYQGDINQVMVKYVPGVDAARIKAAVDKVLEPYGRVASLERRDQLSHVTINAEFDQLKNTSATLPTIFLMVGAAIMYISISRMVRDQRTQVGVLKALGYTGRQVLALYSAFAVAGGLLGAIIGIVLGTATVPLMMQQYQVYYNLPLGRGRIAWEEVGAALAASLAVSLLAGYLAARGVLALKPAQAMRPAAPPGAARVALEHIPLIWGRLPFAWKMAVRNLWRHKGRAALTIMGATFAVALLVLAMFTRDAVDYLLVEEFARKQRHDLAVSTARPFGREDVFFLKAIPGVSGVEPYARYPARIRSGGAEKDITLKGMPRGSRMYVLVDADGRRVEVPATGILLDGITARKMQLRPGDVAWVKLLNGREEERPLLVRGVVQELMGGGAFSSLEQVNSLAGEAGTANGAWITSWDPDRVREVLAGSPVVLSVSSPADTLKDFEKLTGMLIFSVALTTAFGVAMGFSIIYTLSSINIEERKRAIAFVKALGLTSRQAASIVFNENTVLSALGIILGLPLGNMAAKAFMAVSAGDLWSFPVRIYPATYLFAAFGGYVFVILAQQAGRKRIARLDPVEELKTPE